MDRLACVDVPALPLQLLFTRKPSWAEAPAAVVDRDKPQGTLLWVNERARRAGILPGQRYAEALALASMLRAAEVSPGEIAACVDQLVEICRGYTPEVEPCVEEPGVFFLGAGGLGRLFPERQAWAEAIRVALVRAGFSSKVVVGFRRFGAYAIARAIPRPIALVLAGAEEESRSMRRVPLSRIGLDPAVRESLAALAVRTIGQLLDLPEGGVRARFGREAHRLHRLGSGALDPPLAPRAAASPLTRRRELDDPEEHREALLFLVKGELEPLLRRLADRGEALGELAVVLVQPKGVTTEARVRPAEPTLDAGQILGLMRLRLEATELAAGAIRLEVTAIGAPATAEQLRLFAHKPRRDPLAAARALARVRASLGVDAVVRPRITDGHLPEARFDWEPIDRLVPALPKRNGARPLVRRILARSEPLPPRPVREPDGWLLRGLHHGPVERCAGPYVVSGAWWRREIVRDYYFAELRSGALSWVYYDRRRRRWYRQGDVQ